MTRDIDVRGHLAAALEEARALHSLLGEEVLAAVAEAVDTLVSCLAHGGKILAFGNGGSAADAQHLVAELVGRFRRDRRGLPALALTTDSSVLTAVANDLGFADVFARQVCALAVPGDVVIAISTSGRSENVLRGIAAARALGVTTVGIVGPGESLLADSVDHLVAVPGDSVARVQELQLLVEHMLCECVEEIMASERPPAVVHRGSRKILDWDELLVRRRAWADSGMVVVWTNGCFDLLHAGHVASLRAARALGDILVVGVNGDAAVEGLKGPGRPVVPAVERLEVVAALEAVDAVVVFEEETPARALEQLRPDVHCKGADWADDRPMPEREVVEAYGGRIVFLPIVEGVSTSDLVRKIEERGRTRP